MTETEQLKQNAELSKYKQRLIELQEYLYALDKETNERMKLADHTQFVSNCVLVSWLASVVAYLFIPSVPLFVI